MEFNNYIYRPEDFGAVEDLPASLQRLGESALRVADAMESLGYVLYERPDVIVLDILDADVIDC